MSTTESGTVFPVSPSVSTADGGGPTGPCTTLVPVVAGPCGPPRVSVCATKSRRTAPKRLSTSEPRSPTGCPGVPKSGRVAAVSVWGASPRPATDQDPTDTGWARPVHPTPSNSLA